MEYKTIKKFLKPKQIEILDKVLQEQAEKEFLELCKSNLICPSCGSKLFVEESDHLEKCLKCGYINIED